MTGTMRQIPDSSALNQLALATASRCGVDVDAVAGDVMNTSPINGEPLAVAQLGHRRHRRRQRHPGTGGLPAVARGSCPCPRRPGQAAGRAARRTQGRPRHPDQPRGRQDHLRGARRGAGDDRHLRLRSRPLPSALRAHDDLRAAGSPTDGDLAPARRGRCHQRVQLPRSRVVLEHGRRTGLWRPGHLEALGAGPPDSARQSRHPGPGHRRLRRARRPQPGAHRWSRHRDRRSWTTPGSPCSARPARPAWVGQSDRASRIASAAPCSSSAGTTPPS